ncbi:hypothetical protein QF010_005690 [Pseudomonas silensiensis]
MSQHPWKHSIADVYANNYGGVVQDYLKFSVRAHENLQSLPL